MVIALWWKDLWVIGGGVLPLAYHSFKGGYEEAAATLLLNHVTRNILDLDATYLGDALTALNIQDRDVPRQLEPQLQGVIDTLKPGTPAAIKAAYDELVGCRRHGVCPVPAPSQPAPHETAGDAPVPHAPPRPSGCRV